MTTTPKHARCHCIIILAAAILTYNCSAAFGAAAAGSPAAHSGIADGSIHAVASGSITGRVQNASSGQRLNNARVAIQGSTTVVFTDESGLYRLVNVPAGRVLMEVSYTGLDSQIIP